MGRIGSIVIDMKTQHDESSWLYQVFVLLSSFSYEMKTIVTHNSCSIFLHDDNVTVLASWEWVKLAQAEGSPVVGLCRGYIEGHESDVGGAQWGGGFAINASSKLPTAFFEFWSVDRPRCTIRKVKSGKKERKSVKILIHVWSWSTEKR